MKLIRTHLLFIIFLFCYVALLSYKLISAPVPFADWDESLYIQTGNEMYEQRYFLLPIWQEKLWFDKSPLIPLVYATTAKLFWFVAPEVSTRLLSLGATAVVLTFIYLLYRRITHEGIVPTLTVIITAFTPIFLQRAQIINLDVFLLLGWLGYILWYKNFFAGLFFLGISVYSKSLIGFYPVGIVGMYLLYQRYQKQISHKELMEHVKKMALQGGILITWFILMLVMYKGVFWRQHFIESHLSRITSSIEFHFGTKTYYLDLAREQFGNLFMASFMGAFLVFAKFFKDKTKLLYGFFLLPWFIFLNLTKTKIFWYFYPAIPQFAFFSIFPLSFAAQAKRIYALGAFVVVGIFMFYSVFSEGLLTKTYASASDSHYQMALYAKEKCSTLNVLLDEETRTSFDTLGKAGLLITTTKWWGSHPSIVYYFDKPVAFLYSVDELNDRISQGATGDCFAGTTLDKNLFVSQSKLQELTSFEPFHLFIYE